MTTTFRAAYIPASVGSTSGGFLLTDESLSGLSDADLIAAARSVLDEYNADARAIGAAEATEADIVVGDWNGAVL